MNVVDLLPHRGAAVLLTAIGAADADSLRATARVPSDGPYAADAWASAALLEVAAQAAAAHLACTAFERGDPPPAAGYLVGVKDAQLRPDVPLDVELTVMVRRRGAAGALTTYHAEVGAADGWRLRGELGLWVAAVGERR